MTATEALIYRMFRRRERIETTVSRHTVSGNEDFFQTRRCSVGATRFMLYFLSAIMDPFEATRYRYLPAVVNYICFIRFTSSLTVGTIMNGNLKRVSWWHNKFCTFRFLNIGRSLHDILLESTFSDLFQSALELIICTISHTVSAI